VPGRSACPSRYEPAEVYKIEEDPMINKLAQRQFQLVFTYAPAGLGHLRVTDALYRGLPETANPVVLGSNDKSIRAIHRITSINPFFRSGFEWFQSGPFSSLSNRIYRAYLRSGTRLIHERLASLIEEKFEPPTEILVISTHFGLAHKLAAVKEKLQKEKQVKIFLGVIVTDDTFQHIWYVDGADLIVVPSHFVKEQYIAYGKSLGTSVRIEVLPYPLGPGLGRELDSKGTTSRINQLDAMSEEPIRVSIPISGAAVGTDYFLSFIEALRGKSERFRFHIVSKDAPYTKNFLSTLSGENWVDIHAAKADREVVDAYDDLFEEHVISLEVTKPSEQAFKALLGTHLRGGVILLFSEPVGKQEFDNLDFLQRHFLVPSMQTNVELWQMAENQTVMDDAAKSRLLDEARSWRGVRIPEAPRKAANFIWWMLTTGVFSQMMACDMAPNLADNHPDELGPDGVAKFWNLVVSI
jgi:hypothetical protein